MAAAKLTEAEWSVMDALWERGELTGREAAELLRDSSLSVLGVAQSVGYGSASQFSAAFHRQYGMTPAKYRKMSGPA